MPLFSRCDGTLIRDESPVRLIIPRLMRGRNESIIFYDTVFNLTKTLMWLESYNGSRPPGEHATVFHLFLWACAQVLHRRPGMNRFASGGNLYQRNEVTLSFVAKKEMKEGVPFVTIKQAFPAGETFPAMVRRVRATIGEGRTGPERPVDREVRLVTRLPGFILGPAIALLKWLDSRNLMPASMIRSDPMFCSMFVANVGSLGVDSAFHHLYEWGNATLFGVMGRVQRHLFIGTDGAPCAADGLSVKWSFDERVNDGLYCANSLKIGREIIEDPAAGVAL